MTIMPSRHYNTSLLLPDASIIELYVDELLNLGVVILYMVLTMAIVLLAHFYSETIYNTEVISTHLDGLLQCGDFTTGKADIPQEEKLE